jgi:3-mercaptopyruvate sulfurtransferase SseA
MSDYLFDEGPIPRTVACNSQDFSIQVYGQDLQQASRAKSAVVVDVRNPQEFTGEILAPAGLPETCQRGGHVPDRDVRSYDGSWTEWRNPAGAPVEAGSQDFGTASN